MKEASYLLIPWTLKGKLRNIINNSAHKLGNLDELVQLFERTNYQNSHTDKQINSNSLTLINQN